MLATLAATPAIPALAQFRVEVTGVGLTQLPIAIAQFKAEGSAPLSVRDLAQSVASDMSISGFAPIDARGVRVANADIDALRDIEGV